MDRFMQQGQGQGNMMGMQNMRFGAHEFLETQEALRCKAAHIELYGVMINQTECAHLRDILTNQQRRMMQTYQQGLGVMMNQGLSMQMPHTPQMNQYEQVKIGLHNPQMPYPNANAKTMSDQTIATIALGLHKSGAVMAMNWALECTNPQLRTYHATCANTCQEMAYELFQYMNSKGLYQVPQLADHTMNSMMQGVQMGGQMGQMGGMAQMGGMQSGYGQHQQYGGQY